VSQEQEVFAMVMEMIHTSSLIHDDVIDHGETRRGLKAIHRISGNKAAILGGDYLIATASYMCAKLDRMPLMRIISDIMENLSKGELIQKEIKTFDSYDQLLQIYVNKTYYKTAALLAYGCQGIGMLNPT
jgi:geranylgeranyl pyrophosphate synthase